MILAIDVGNTNIVIGTIEAGEISNIVRIHTDLRETGTEYAIKLGQIADFYGIDLKSMDGAIISGQHKVNKPDPEIYKLLFRTYPEIDPPHTLYIDDVKRNCDAGSKAGLIAFNLPKDGAIEEYLEFFEE